VIRSAGPDEQPTRNRPEEHPPVTVPPQADSDGGAGSRTIPEASVVPARGVPAHARRAARRPGSETVSSDELAAVTGVNPAKLRKDLSYIGSYGIRGVGYEVRALLHQLERVLGLNHRQAVALVGVGNLGHALAGYNGFGGRGFPVAALFDVDPDLVGIHINGIVVEHVSAIPEVCAAQGVTIGMIATPGPAAQGVCDLLVESGVRCILNFAPVVLQVPDEVEVRKVDLAVELQVLAFHVARRHVAGHASASNGSAANGTGGNGRTRNGHAPGVRTFPLVDGTTTSEGRA
jgi:redox-sensing transcriptional repressor